MKYRIIRALLQFYLCYGDDLTVECPVGSGTQMTLFEVAREIADRLISTFTRDRNGRRPVYGGTEKFQSDPHWKDYILFYEYFHVTTELKACGDLSSESRPSSSNEGSSP